MNLSTETTQVLKAVVCILNVIAENQQDEEVHAGIVHCIYEIESIIMGGTA
jgi:hypothetical protein